MECGFWFEAGRLSFRQDFILAAIDLCVCPLCGFDKRFANHFRLVRFEAKRLVKLIFFAADIVFVTCAVVELYAGVHFAVILSYEYLDAIVGDIFRGYAPFFAGCAPIVGHGHQLSPSQAGGSVSRFSPTRNRLKNEKFHATIQAEPGKYTFSPAENSVGKQKSSA